MDSKELTARLRILREILRRNIECTGSVGLVKRDVDAPNPGAIHANVGRQLSIALSRVNDGKGGAGVVAVVMTSSPGIDSFGISINSRTCAAISSGRPCRWRDGRHRQCEPALRALLSGSGGSLPTVRPASLRAFVRRPSSPHLRVRPEGIACASARGK